MINSLYDVYFGKNDSEDSFAHVGRSKRDGAKVGSGRYPLGSGKNPNQHEKGIDKLKNVFKKDKEYYFSERRIPVIGISKSKAKKKLPEETYNLWEKIIDYSNSGLSDITNGTVEISTSNIDKYYKDGKHRRTEIVLTRPVVELARYRDTLTKQEQKIVDIINEDPNFKIVSMLNSGKYNRLDSITAYNGKDQILDVVWRREDPYNRF